MNLNMACGEKSFPDSINADLRVTSIVHLICNFDRFPYPFKDGVFDAVWAPDIIEHLTDVVPVMDEIHRLLRPNGKLSIRTTAWDTEQSYKDPTHKHWFTMETFDLFDPHTKFGSEYGWYTQRKWRVLHRSRDGQELCFVLAKRAPGDTYTSPKRGKTTTMELYAPDQ